MSKYFWTVVAFFAILIYVKIGYTWVPVIWNASWGDGFIIAMSLVSLIIVTVGTTLEEWTK